MQSYQSHRRVAMLYQQMMRARYAFSKSFDEAQIVILHLEPHNYERLYRQYPVLFRKYVIAYCVWEANPLPVAYQQSLRYVQEVWTCSKYCHSIFVPHHPKVVHVPHPIHRDLACTETDLACIRAEINYSPDYTFYLSFTRTLGTRKNVAGLVRAFERINRITPNTRLILKGIPGDPYYDVNNPNIIYLQRHLSEAQINALYRSCQCYVSAHHSEGWGLPISDAMLLGMPVVATGYSGNLEYMNKDNSFLTEFREEYIRREDRFGLFTGSMKWAYPSEENLSYHMGRVYETRHTSLMSATIARAQLDVRKFSMDAVRGVVYRQITWRARP